jgi:hypothetical protein
MAATALAIAARRRGARGVLDAATDARRAGVRP